MSVMIKYPNGYVGTVSDAVAEILEKRPGHEIVADAPKKSEKKEESKK